MRFLKTEFEFNKPVNIYLDRPDIYLSQLVNLGSRLFIVGGYDKPLPKGYRNVGAITPDISPTLVISQTKLENFANLFNLSREYEVPFIHIEQYPPPSKIKKPDLNRLKSTQADVNIYTNECVMADWDAHHGLIIENAYSGLKFKADKPYYASNNLPIAHMYNKIIPIVLENKYTSKYIFHGHNGFLFKSDVDLSAIVNRLDKMDKEDRDQIGQNAWQTANKFTQEKYLSDWRKLYENIFNS